MNSDNMWLTVMGLIIIISIVGLLIAKKINPVVGMTIIPCLGAMILGYSVTDLVGFLLKVRPSHQRCYYVYLCHYFLWHHER